MFVFGLYETNLLVLLVKYFGIFIPFDELINNFLYSLPNCDFIVLKLKLKDFLFIHIIYNSFMK